MLGLFVSCVNSLGNQMAKGSSLLDVLGGKSSIIDILQDESADSIMNLDVTYYDNPKVDPKAAHDFGKFLTGDSASASVVRFPEGISKSNLADGVKAEFSGDPDNARYLVCPYVRAEYFNGSSIFNMPLVIKIDAFDKDSGLLKGSLVTGHYDSESGSYGLGSGIEDTHIVKYNDRLQRIDTLFFALSDIPDFSALSEDSKYSAFILKSDCPAIRKDAKKGDVFVFGQSEFEEESVDSSEREPVLDSWIKLYSLKDKLDLLIDNPKKEFMMRIDGDDVVLDPKAFMYDHEFSSHTECDHGSHSFATASAIPGGRTQVVFPVPEEDRDKLYLMEELLVENVCATGYNDAGVIEHPVRLMVAGFDANSGNPIVRAVNGIIDNPDDLSAPLPSIPAGSKITILDDREKVTPTLALMLNDLKLKVNDIERECRRGELIALVGDKIIPVEFDAFFRE